MIEVLNIEAANVVLRNHGVRISPETLRSGIEQKVFPFGDCIRTKNGNPVFLVYQKQLDDWIEAHTGEGALYG